MRRAFFMPKKLQYAAIKLFCNFGGKGYGIWDTKSYFEPSP